MVKEFKVNIENSFLNNLIFIANKTSFICKKQIIKQKVTIIQVDEYVKNVLHKTMITLQDYLDQICDPMFKWDTILKMEEFGLS